MTKKSASANFILNLGNSEESGYFFTCQDDENADKAARRKLDDEIKADVLRSITIRPYETLLYYVYGLSDGEYKITLMGGNGNIVVTNVYGSVLLEEGKSEGFFTIELEEDEVSGTAYLYFTNTGNKTGTTAITFNALVAQTPVKTLAQGKTQNIIIGAGETRNYEIVLIAGFYQLTLAHYGGTQIKVRFDGGKIDLKGGESREFVVSVTGTHVFTFTNTSKTQAAVGVTIEKFID